TVKIADGGALAWLPQETILFDRSCLRRTIDVELASDARLLLLESVVFGRSGMGEAVDDGRLFDRWRIRQGGKLIYAETARLDGAIEHRLAQKAGANGSIATATFGLVPGNDPITDRVHAPDAQFR